MLHEREAGVKGDVCVICGVFDAPTTCSGLVWCLGVPPQRHATPAVAVNTPARSTQKCPSPITGLEIGLRAVATHSAQRGLYRGEGLGARGKGALVTEKVWRSFWD